MVCQLGYADIADILLCNGATLPRPKSGSLGDVFFVTASSGWLPVLDVLLQNREGRAEHTSIVHLTLITHCTSTSQ